MALKGLWLVVFMAFVGTVMPLDSALANKPTFEEVIQQQELSMKANGYRPWKWMKSSCNTCEVYFQAKNPALMSDDVQLFLQSLNLRKTELMLFYKVTGDEYNLLAHMAVGILGRESEFFESRRYQVKENFQGVVRIAKILRNLYDPSKRVTSNSRGPTQIKTVPSMIERAYGFTTDELARPDNAAIATMGFLIEALGELKRRAKIYKLEFITPQTYVDYLPYIYFGSASALNKRTATPDKNIYIQAMRKYMSWVDVYEREPVQAPRN